MKNLLLAIVLLVSTIGFSQMADYRLQELTIDVKQPINNCELTLIIDDVYYPVEAHQVDGSIITLYLAEYQDYHIIINHKDYINISLFDIDIIDDRDLSISADVDYQFEKGILVFNY
jgi:hypothetical protein